MPYIPQEQRAKVDKHIEKLADALRKEAELGNMASAGLLNYAVTRLLVRTLPARRYWAMALGVGTLVCAIFEFYRRYAAPYEDEAIETNGDIKEYTT